MKMIWKDSLGLLGFLRGLRRLGLFLLLLLRLLFFLFLALNRVVYFSAMNRNTLRGCYTETDFVPPYIDDDNLDIIAYHNRLISLSA